MDDHDYYDNSTYFDEDYEDDPLYSSSSSSSIHRLLAPVGGTPTVDYAVISVVVITLGLILAIEVGRHQLDVAASGNPFFHTVLELMYRELTTLGIVEFCIYLMHKYYKEFNFKMEAIFVDVHFMLFYTAVFNAIQSSLVRVVAGYRTDKSWLQTEDIDIGHYVAIRKEFDRVESKMNANGWEDNSLSRPGDLPPPSSYWRSFQKGMHNLAFRIRHPQLSRRNNQLLVPIRFHELRAHFIDSNNLPPRFKVSHYLKRSLTTVLLDFVHISSAAWILLMATANLLYFLSGMILYKTEDSLDVEQFLFYIFVACMVFFVGFAFVLYFKMKSIFSSILRMKLTVMDTEGSTHKAWRGFSALDTAKSVNQVKLFWGNNPHLIIVATQYMQFGYALGLAVIFTYFKDFTAKAERFRPQYLLLMLLLSYFIFLGLVSAIIPWYTLCTSMGQLVNKERLHETLAKLKLSEETRKKESLEEEAKAEEEIARRKREIEAKNAEAVAITNSNIPGQRKGGLSMRNVFRSLTGQDKDQTENMGLSSSCRGARKGSAETLGELQNPSFHASDEGGNTTWLRRTRKKSVSDGVQNMMSAIGHSGSASSSGSPKLSAAASQKNAHC